MRALQPMEAVLVHHWLDRRHLGDLVPQRRGIVAVEVVADSSGRLGGLHSKTCRRRSGGTWGPGRDGDGRAARPRSRPETGGRRPALDRGRVWTKGLGCGQSNPSPELGGAS